MFEEADDREEGPTAFSTTGYHTEFVGRRDVREELKTALKGKVRLLQILGGPVVGKSRLAEQMYNELIREAKDTNTQLKTVRILLRKKDAQNVTVIQLKILEEFANKDVALPPVDFQNKICCILKSQPETYFLVFLDDCDQMISTNLSRTTFLELVYSLVHFPKLKVILTSRVQFSLPRIDGRFQKTHRLEGMTLEEASTLLSRAAPNVTISSSCEQTIYNHCCGLPLLLIIVARTLEDKRLMISPQDLCDLWNTSPLNCLSADLASDEDNIEQIIQKFVASLDEDLKRILSVFAYFPGTFSPEAATQVARFQNVSQTKLLGLIRLYDRSMVEFDAGKGRYSISPIIRDYVNCKLRHLRDTDSVRLQFCDFFCKLMAKANSNFGRERTDIVIGRMFDEWVNVEKTLREAVHPTADLFRINMKIVRDAPDIITSLVPEYAETYYRQCLTGAEMFGTKADIGCIESCIGCAVGYSKGGNGLQVAFELLQSAESKLPAEGYQFVKLMSHLEWNSYRQGNMAEAARYQQRALDVIPEGPEKSRILRTQTNVSNHKALRHILEGKCEEAIEVLEKTMETTTQTFEHHPAVRVILNSFGLAYAQLDQHDMALKYFEASLAQRRKYSAQGRRDLVIPLSNVAATLSDRGKFGVALKLLDEALEIRESILWQHLDTATALTSKGKILRKSGRFKEAEKSLTEAQNIYQACVDRHFALADIGIQIAQCFVGSGQIGKARAKFREVINSKDKLQQQHQLTLFILQAFEQLLELSSGEEWFNVAAEMCLYLENALAGEDSPELKKSSKHAEKLQDIQASVLHRKQREEVMDRPVSNEGKAGKEEGKDGGMVSNELLLNVAKCGAYDAVNLMKTVSKLENNQNNLNITTAEKPTSKMLVTKENGKGCAQVSTHIHPIACSPRAGPSHEAGCGIRRDETACEVYHEVINMLIQTSNRDCSRGYNSECKAHPALSCENPSCSNKERRVPELPNLDLRCGEFNGTGLVPQEHDEGATDQQTLLYGLKDTQTEKLASSIYPPTFTETDSVALEHGDCTSENSRESNSMTEGCSTDTGFIGSTKNRTERSWMPEIQDGGFLLSDSSTLVDSSLSDSETVCQSVPHEGVLPNTSHKSTSEEQRFEAQRTL